MSNDYFLQHSIRTQQADLVRSAEQYRLVKAAKAAQAAPSGSGEEKGGARRRHLRGVRLFGRSPRPTAC